MANTPEGGYAAYGVDALGMNPDGYPSNEDNTFVDHGFAGCPGRDPKPDHHEGGTGDNRCPDLAAGDTANAC